MVYFIRYPCTRAALSSRLLRRFAAFSCFCLTASLFLPVTERSACQPTGPSSPAELLQSQQRVSTTVLSSPRRATARAAALVVLYSMAGMRRGPTGRGATVAMLPGPAAHQPSPPRVLIVHRPLILAYIHIGVRRASAQLRAAGQEIMCLNFERSNATIEQLQLHFQMHF